MSEKKTPEEFSEEIRNLIEANRSEYQKSLQKAYENMLRAIPSHLVRVFGNGYIQKFSEKEVIARKHIERIIPSIFSGEKGLIISGSVGVGKTMAMIYIYKRLLEMKAKKALESEDMFLLDIYRMKQDFAFYYVPEIFTAFHMGQKVSLRKYIFLDDFGTEYSEPFALSNFDAWIEKIYRRGFYGIVMTTNLSHHDFLNRQGFIRISDRLNQMCAFLEVKGASRR